MKFNKGIKFRIISLVVAVTFFSNSTAYGMEFSATPHIRVPVIDRERLNDELLTEFQKRGVGVKGVKRLSYNEIREIFGLLTKIPEKHFQFVRRIIFSRIKMNRGIYVLGVLLLMPDEYSYSYMFSHEIGHAVYRMLSKQQKNLFKEFKQVSWERNLIAKIILGGVFSLVSFCIMTVILFLSDVFGVTVPALILVTLAASIFWIKVGAILVYGRPRSENGFVSEYAKTTPAEDFAETYRVYLSDEEVLQGLAGENDANSIKYSIMQRIFGEGRAVSSSL